jgi:alpha-galactosidase
VELSTSHDDFASTIGVGGVLGTEFTWPPGSAGRNRDDLTPAREQVWAKRIGIHKDKMLSRGEYPGTLYDIGFDRPEGHAIRKSENMYYAFYAPIGRAGSSSRGLANRTYRVTDYENGKDLGTLHGPIGTLEAEFSKHLLLEAMPE